MADDRIQLRRDIASNWTSANPVLSQGEIGLELDTGLMKIGDGVSYWVSLSYSSTSWVTLSGTVPTIPFDTSPSTIPTDEGSAYWDATDGTLSIVMGGGTVIQQVGLETYFKARNTTGSSIANGVPVMATGVVSGTDRLQISPAIANGTIPSVRFIGLVTEDISNNGNGFVTNFGFVRDVNTTGSLVGETWAVGDILYVSQSTAGALTKVEPTTGLKLTAAIVVTVNATTGILLTRSTPVVLEDLFTKSSLTGAIGNLSTSLTNLQLKNNLLTSQGQSICTFTRASAATYIDRYGVVKSVTTDTPRFSLQGLGFNPTATNILTYSEQFDHANWVKVRCSISANAITAPDGTLTADKIVEDTSATQNHYISQVVSATGGWLSVFAKAGERSRLQIRAAGGADQRAAGFDLSSGAIFTETQSSTVQTSDARIEAFANGWYRCSILASGTDNTAIQVALDNGTTHSYTGDGTSGLYIWGAQWESGAVLTSYILTTTASVTRAGENLSLPQAENLPYYANNLSILLDYMPRHIGTINHTLISDDSEVSIVVSSTGGINVTFGTATISYAAGLVRDTKYRICVTKTATTLTLYLNGVSVATTAVGTLPINQTSLFIGSEDGSTNPALGIISNLRLYDFAMTAEEVRLA